jgi:hypothetical protein
MIDATTAALTASDTITVIEGFDAMRIFLATVWRRHGRDPEDIAFVLGGAKWADGAPVDARCGRIGSPRPWPAGRARMRRNRWPGKR